MRDAVDAQEETALHKAARYGFADCAQALIHAGSSINALYILLNNIIFYYIIITYMPL